MSKATQFVIYTAIDIPAPYADHVMYRPNPKVPGGIEVYVPQLGKDQEVTQLATEVPVRPISESKFRELMRQQTEALLIKARSAGLVSA